MAEVFKKLSDLFPSVPKTRHHVKLADRSDSELKLELKALTTMLGNKKLVEGLPDKGEKLRAQVAALKAELEKRQQQASSSSSSGNDVQNDGCKTPPHLKRLSNILDTKMTAKRKVFLLNKPAQLTAAEYSTSSVINPEGSRYCHEANKWDKKAASDKEVLNPPVETPRRQLKGNYDESLTVLRSLETALNCLSMAESLAQSEKEGRLQVAREQEGKLKQINVTPSDNLTMGELLDLTKKAGCLQVTIEKEIKLKPRLNVKQPDSIVSLSASTNNNRSGVSAVKFVPKKSDANENGCEDDLSDRDSDDYSDYGDDDDADDS